MPGRVVSERGNSAVMHQLRQPLVGPPAARDSAQDGVHQSGGSSVDPSAGQLDRFVDGCVRAHPHLVQLVHAQAQDIAKGGLHGVQ